MSEQARVHLFHCSYCKILVENPSDSSVYKCRGCGHIFQEKQRSPRDLFSKTSSPGTRASHAPYHQYEQERQKLGGTMIPAVELCINIKGIDRPSIGFNRLVENLKYQSTINQTRIYMKSISEIKDDNFILVASLMAVVTLSFCMILRGVYGDKHRLTKHNELLAKEAASLVTTITNYVALISFTQVYLDDVSARSFKPIWYFTNGELVFVVIVVAHIVDVLPIFSTDLIWYYDYACNIMRVIGQRLGMKHVPNRKGEIILEDVGAGTGIMNQKHLKADTISKCKGKASNMFLDNYSLNPSHRCRHFTFDEIHLATNKFDDEFVIGNGGFGKVYKGCIDNGTTTVAIKRLNPLSKQGDKEFRTEIEMLSKFRHCHLVSLIGYCDDNDEMILVYEYMSKGSLADHLHQKNGGNSNNNTNILCWVARLKICIGVARGLDYLHSGTGFLQRVIHRDVKTANILLDENSAAKISDFGLSKIGPSNQSFTHVITCVKGTHGYIDPDYLLTHRLTRKSDVYAFGVVLFQVLSGRKALDERLPKEQRVLVLWAQNCIQEDKVHYLIDPNLKWEIFPDSLKEFVNIANRCLHSSPKRRPKMSEVVATLESALALQERKDSSLLDNTYDFDFDFDFGGTCDGQKNSGSSTVRPEVINPGDFKVESTVSTDDDENDNDDSLIYS